MSRDDRETVEHYIRAMNRLVLVLIFLGVLQLATIVIAFTALV